VQQGVQAVKVTPNELYEAMAAHPDTGPVMEQLALVEPVDEFSRALCLVRDCFDPSPTLRLLSRRKLRDMLSSRMALMMAYQQMVIDAVPGAKTFAAAVANGNPATIDRIRATYEKQAAELMARPLPKI